MLMIERWTTLKGFFELPMCLLSVIILIIMIIISKNK